MSANAPTARRGFTRGDVFLILLAAAAVLACAAWLKPHDAGCDDDGCRFEGWVGDEFSQEVRELSETRPVFSLARPGEIPGTRAGDDVDLRTVNVRLWEPLKNYLGRHPPLVPQEVGDCVGQGWATAIETHLGVNAARGFGVFREVHPSFVYGLSRAVAKERLAPEAYARFIRGDGSLGALAAEAVTRGVLRLEGPAIPEYSGDVSRQWGGPGGPPAALLDQAEMSVVRTTAKIPDARSAAIAVANGYPVAICSKLGFSRVREADGRLVGVRDKTWHHCMAVTGFDGTAGRSGYFYFQNSWPVSAEPLFGAEPLQGEPPGGFWVTFEDVEVALAESPSDTFAVSAFDGFPPLETDFHFLGLGPRRGPPDTLTVLAS
ncbi:MAG: hypothetical protein AAF532_03595 [Planctomycetota bacterium]